MRAFVFLLAASALGCHAIVGSYEVSDDDAGARDTATPSDTTTDAPADTRADSAVDTAVSDTSDAGLVVTSCKAWKAKGVSTNGAQQIIPVGSPGYPSGVRAFCEIAGGFTLVATRSSTTNGTAWAAPDPMAAKPLPPSGVTRSIDLGPDDADAYLDMDWKLLGFTEVVYDLGAPAGMGPAKTRISFRDLTSEQVDAALSALVRGHPPEKRPNCYVDSSTTAVTSCLPPTMPPGDPMKSLGWAYAPTGVQCYWGYTDAPGTKACDGTTVGKGRVLVR